MLDNPMSHKKHCCLCEIVKGKKRFGSADSPFLENDEFIALPSIGAFIEGWSLIVPKSHVVSMKEHYRSEVLKSFTSEVCRRVESSYGDTIIFEHGAHSEGSLTGCGVDHAHLHVVPHSTSLRPLLLESGLSWKECSPANISDIAGDKEYLFYSDGFDSLGLIHVLDSPKSQFFRKLLADVSGNQKISDYKTFPLTHTSQSTFEKLSA